MNTSKKIIAGILAVTTIATLLVVTLFRGGARPVPPTARGASAAGPRVHWPENKRYAYTLSWRASTSGQVAAGGAGNKEGTSLSMEANVDGEIALQRAGGADSAQVIALSYTRFDKFSFDMQGQESQASAEQITKSLAGQTAFLTIDQRGRVGAIAFPPEMEPTVRTALRSLALQLGYTLPEGDEASWEADEADSLGEVHVRYQRGANELARQPVAFNTLDLVHGPLDGKQTVRGGTLIAVDENGVPLSFDETIDATYVKPGTSTPAVHSSWRFTLVRKAVSSSDARLGAVAEHAQVQPLRAQINDPEREKRRDQRLAKAMNTDQMLQMIDRYQAGAKLGDEFLVRAAAFLRLHPEAFPPLLAKFNLDSLSVKGRGLILDVLAQTGNAKAQEAMRTALSSAVAHAKTHDFSALVQRFTFVLEPDAASIKFLEETYDANEHGGDVESAQGTVVALGSAVRRLTIQHDLAAANEINDRLRSGLRQAQTPAMRGALVAALGNAARPEDVPDIASVATDADARVRDQVAAALRTVDSPGARQALFSLAIDHNTGVATKAFEALHSQSLGDSDWQTLEEIAQQGTSPTSSDAALLNLVRDKDKTIARPEARQILSAMLTRNQGSDSDIPVIIRGLLKDAN